MFKALNDKIEIIKSEVNFFFQPLLWVDHEFNYIPMDIDKEFLYFENYFNEAFLLKIDRKHAIDRFIRNIYNDLGFRSFLTKLDGNEFVWKFDWSSLVEYTIDGEFYDNTYFANHRKDPITEEEEYMTDHVIDGFDKKTKVKVIELLEYLKLKISEFRNRVYLEILDSQSFDKAKSGLEELENENIKQYNNDFNVIIDLFNALDGNLKWECVFRSEDDMELIADLLAKYFNKLPYNIPSKIIDNQIRSKTKLSSAINEIYKLNRNINSKMISDTEFFRILKSLSVYKDLDNNSIYNSITK